MGKWSFLFAWLLVCCFFGLRPARNAQGIPLALRSLLLAGHGGPYGFEPGFVLGLRLQGKCHTAELSLLPQEM